MANPLQSLLQLSSLQHSQVMRFFTSVEKTQVGSRDSIVQHSNKVASLLFFEPSTRTRFSFETACVRLGVKPVTLSGSQSTSLEKGETLEDSVLNMAALEPDVFIIRAPQEFPLLKIASDINIPIINAGWGSESHPTQALLDFYTLYRQYKTLQSLKIVYVGDTQHSRVVRSHLELAETLQVEVAFCGPAALQLQTAKSVKRFETLTEALGWADVIYLLRVQKERFTQATQSMVPDLAMVNFTMNKNLRSHLREDQVLMHPGPVNYGVEIDEEMARHPQSLILKQVNNGLYVRQQLIANLFTQGACL